MQKRKLRFILSIFLCINLLLPQIIMPAYAHGFTAGGTVNSSVYGDGGDTGTISSEVYGDNGDTVGDSVYGIGLEGIGVALSTAAAVYGAWYLDNPEATAFTISNAEELRYLAELVNGEAVDGEGAQLDAVNFSDDMITLANDITLTGAWTPIGNYSNKSNQFNGTFEGGENTISLPVIGSEHNPIVSDYYGLFGYASGAAIKNLTVNGAIYGSGQYVGGIVGYAAGSTFQNCVFGTDAASGISNYYNTPKKIGYTGGIVGNMAGSPKVKGVIGDCTNNGTVLSLGNTFTTYTGGIAGAASSTQITNAKNTGGVEGNSYAGGIVAFASSSPILSSVNTGTVKSSGSYVAGIGGNITDIITDCENDGEISGGAQYTGGIAGKTTKAVSGCTNNGAVQGGAEYVGGLVGYFSVSAASSFISDCVNNGEVWGASDNVGGIAGYAQYNGADNCGNKAAVTGKSNVGGIIGYVARNVKDCQNESSVSGEQNVGGITGSFVGGGTYNLTGCDTSAESTITGESNVGGIAGYATGTAQNNTNRAKVTGTGNVGGIIGDTTALVATCLNDSGAVLAGGANVGGIAGRSAAKIQTSCNLAPAEAITGEEAVGSILGQANGATAQISGCFSYTNQELSGSEVNIGNSCYLAGEDSTCGKTAESFKYGQVAYIVDGGEDTHSNVWRQGDNYPVFSTTGTDSVYKLSLSQPAESYAAGSATFAELPAGDEYSHCKYFTAPDGGRYIYLPGGLPVNLQVQKNAGYENYIPTFRPEREVTEDNGVYTVTLGTRNVDLTYGFLNPADNPGGSSAWYNNGKGNAEGEFIIATESDLKYLASLVNGTATDGSGAALSDSFQDKTLELGANITLSQSWTAIGTAGKPFKGTLEGSGHTISGLYVDSGSGHQGLFGYTEGGAIKDLTVSGTVFSDGDCAGGIVGCASNTALTNCTFGGAAETSAVAGASNVGGIAGKATGNLSQCSNAGAAVKGSGAGVGGIAGTAAGAVSDCDNSGTVTGSAGNVGGIAGSADGVVSNCSNEGAVTGEPGCIGGIVGLATNTITDCHNKDTAVITGEGSTTSQYVGGIVGCTTMGVKNCINSAAVTGSQNYIAGIAGFNKSSGTEDTDGMYDIIECSNEGAISGAGYVGGIIGGGMSGGGMGYGISGCTNSGAITGVTQYIGGIAGGSKVSVADSNKMGAENCNNYGSVSCSGNTELQYVGGIIGSLQGKMVGCLNSGSVTGTMDYVGGIVGYAYVGSWNKDINKCGNTGAITGADYVGGIVGYGEKKPTGWTLEIKDCYNLGSVSGALGQENVGGIAGCNKASTNCSFSYASGANGICGSNSTLPYNSYYLVDGESDASAAKNAAAFRNGEVAYLLDLNKAAADKAWTRGEAYPMLKGTDTTGSIYKLTLTKAVDSAAGAGSVTFAPPAEDSPYEILTAEDGSQYTYLPAGTAVTLNADRAPGYEHYNLTFVPADIVTIAGEEGGRVTYKLTMAESNANDLSLKYKFSVPASSSVEWYNPDKDSYHLETYADLVGLAELVNGEKSDGTVVTPVDFSGKTINLDADIVISGGFVPIGTPAGPFTGIFDGNNHTISSLSLDSLHAYQGLFGYTKGGEIKNLTLQGSIKSSNNYIGGIVGYAGGTALTNCQTAGGADGTAISSVSGGNYVGGIAGYVEAAEVGNCTNEAIVSGSEEVGGIAGGINNAALTDCINNASVENSKVDGYRYQTNFGGIAGQASGTISGCTNKGNVTGNTNRNAGIIGELTGTVTRCTNSGAVTNGGGIVGRLSSGTAIYCSNSGDITGGGGITGSLSSGTVTYCSNSGTIAERGGGITAGLGPGTMVAYCSNSGAITGGGGGIASSNYGTVANCYNLGLISGDHATGGIAGLSSDGIVKYCYNYSPYESSDVSWAVIAGVGPSDSSNIVNCYYCSDLLSGTPMDGNYATAKSKEEFKSGEVAYLLDGGNEALRKGIWSQYRTDTLGYPVLAGDSQGVVYKAEIGSVTGGNLEFNSDYNYFNAGDVVSLTVTPAEGMMLKTVKVRTAYYPVDCTRAGLVFTFTMPAADVKVAAEFVASTDEDCTVTFDANGGEFSGGKETNEVKVRAGSQVVAPAAPSRENMAFLGWYTVASGGEKYNFADSATASFTLYAHWKEAGKVIVTFDANGGLVEGAVAYEQIIDSGSQATEPAAPSFSSDDKTISYTFGGWFTQRSGGTEWNFADPVNDDLTLYARWTPTDNLAGGFKIMSAEDLNALKDRVKNGETFAGKLFELGENITLDSDNWQEGIAMNSLLPFQGTFNGNGNTITFQDVSAPLFGYIGDKAEVTGLTVEGSFNVTSDNVGAVAGHNAGKISCITVDVDFSGECHDNIGGVAGIFSEGSKDAGFTDCTNSGTIYGADYVGGIVGKSTVQGAAVERCHNSGVVHGEGGQYIGGIIGGATYSLSISGCTNEGTLLLDGKKISDSGAVGTSNIGSIGGIIGGIHGGTITDCHNEGNITDTATTADPLAITSGVGGIVGSGNNREEDYSSGYPTIDKCSNTGRIEAESTGGVGGLVGTYVYNISESSNTGEIIGKNGAGGLCGSLLYGQIKSCFSTGDVTAVHGVAGGLVGTNGSEVYNCYCTGKIQGATGAYGIEDVGAIRNSYWYGLFLTAANGEAYGISRAGTNSANNYYGLQDSDSDSDEGSPSLTDPNDGVSSALKTAGQFASGEVAYLLDTGNDGSEDAPKSWTQDDTKGYPVLGEPHYCKITVEGSDGGTVAVSLEGSGKQGDPETPIYVAADGSSKITVTAQPKDSETIDGITYTYELECITVNQNGSEKDITEDRWFRSNSDAEVKASFKKEKEKSKSDPPDDDPPGGPDPTPPNESTPKEKNDIGIGNGIGEGIGEGIGDVIGDMIGNVIGNVMGSGAGIGDLIASGQGGTADATTTDKIAAPSPNGEQAADQAVTVARQADVTAVKQDSHPTEQHEEKNSEPAGGGGGGGGSELKEKDDKQPVIFEIVKKAVRDNPLTAGILTAAVLGILLSAGYRRYRKHMGDL
ncbi:InlB B-repeat-containing protein [Desulfoscipio sp. XC116]|uniref:InlB B-repeat-containing protein n=1 Tax=Desulfoscipio sp. XC116 TaxID=3144975 RepID=UPI00325BBFA7